jgi:outer membrane protein
MAVVPLASMPAGAESLQEALTQAYRSNPRLDVARAQQRATDEEVPRANAGYRPTISASADVNWQRTQTQPQSASNGETHPEGVALNLSQPLFRGFRTISQVRQAEATVRAGRETLRNTEESVLLEAATAYADVVRDEAIVRLNENNVVVLTNQLRATQEQFNVGEVTRTDLAQAQARRELAVSQLDVARANLRTSRSTYERSIGSPPGRLTDPGEPRRLLPKSVNEALQIAVRENPVIVNALYLEQAARYNVDLIRGELLPQVTLQANYSKRFDTSRTIDESEVATVTGRLDVPIYSGGEVDARVRQAKHTHVSRLQQVEQIKTEQQALVIAAWSRLESARAQEQSAQAQIQANETALTGVREEYRVGQRTLIDVLNAEQELLNAQVSLVTAKHDATVQAYTVLTNIGRLHAQELGLGSAVYDAEVHYVEVRRKWWGLSIVYADGRREDVDLWEKYGQHAPVK